MKKLIITCLCALIGLCVHSQTQYINPFIGTQGMGHTFPGSLCASWWGATQSGNRYYSS